MKIYVDIELNKTRARTKWLLLNKTKKFLLHNLNNNTEQYKNPNNIGKYVNHLIIIFKFIISPLISIPEATLKLDLANPPLNGNKPSVLI